MLDRAQHAYLLGELHPSRVQKDGKGKSHVQAWDVRRHLIRAFGFGGFDVETIKIELVSQTENNNRWTVIYRAEVRVTVKNPDGTELARYEDAAIGDAINQPSLADAHDLALKTALSQGMKRCATNLGDQFGLSLYNKGQEGAVVRSAYHPEIVAEKAAIKPETEDAPVRGDEDERVADDSADTDAVAVVLASNAVLAMIQGAETKGDLTVAWKEMKAAESRGDLTKHAVELLSEQWQARKEYLLSEGKMT